MLTLTPKTFSWDALGIASSWLCAIHCLITPILLTMIPISSVPFLQDEYFHPAMVIVMAFIVTIALRKGFTQHRNFRVLVLAFIGMLLLFVSAFNLNHLLNETNERLLTLLGGLMISICHAWNWKLIRPCRECCDSAEISLRDSGSMSKE